MTSTVTMYTTMIRASIQWRPKNFMGLGVRVKNDAIAPTTIRLRDHEPRTARFRISRASSSWRKRPETDRFHSRFQVEGREKLFGFNRRAPERDQVAITRERLDDA